MTGNGSIRQYTGSEQCEAGATIHLSLDQFQPMNLALDLAVTPLQGDGCRDGSAIPNESVAEVLYCWQGQGIGSVDPGLQSGGVLPEEYLGKAPYQRAQEFYGGTSPLKTSDELLFVSIELLRVPRDQHGSLAR